MGNKKNLDYSIENHKNFMEALDSFMEIRANLRKFAPDFKVPIQDSKEILEGFEGLAKNLIPIFQNLQIIDKSSLNIKQPSRQIKLQKFKAKKTTSTKGTLVRNASSLFDLLEGKIILVSSNSSKKKLKSIGINAQFIKSSSGPLFIEDYEKLDTKLPEKALSGIKRKLEKLKNELIGLIKDGKEICFIYSLEEVTDNINIDRIDEFNKQLQSDIKLIRVESWSNF